MAGEVDPDIAAKIHTYADGLLNDGTYVDLLDLVMFADWNKKDQLPCKMQYACLDMIGLEMFRVRTSSASRGVRINHWTNVTHEHWCNSTVPA